MSLHQLIAAAPHAIPVASVGQMNRLCHAIEVTIIRERLPIDLYIGFQRLSNLVPQLARYTQLASICRRLVLWAVPDVALPAIPGLQVQPLPPDHPYARLWFLVADSAQLTAMLLTEETTFGQEVARPDRRFSGVWSYDTSLVRRAAATCAEAAGLPYAPPPRDDDAHSRHVGQIAAALAQRAGRPRAAELAWHRAVIARSTLAASEAPLLVVDAARTVIAASPPAAAILGTTSGALVGQPLARCAGGLFAHRDPTQVAAPTMALVAAGPERLIATVSTAIPGPSGEPVGWVIRLHEGQEGAAALRPPALQDQVAQVRAALQDPRTPPAVTAAVTALLAALAPPPAGAAPGPAPASPPTGVRPLGQYLLAHGAVSAGQLQAALLVQRQGVTRRRPRPLGEVLLQQGALDAASLGRALAAQTRDAIQHGASPLAQRIGARLLRAGLIGEAQLAQALGAQAAARVAGQPRRLGAILLAQGALSAAQLALVVEAEGGAPYEQATGQ